MVIILIFRDNLVSLYSSDLAVATIAMNLLFFENHIKNLPNTDLKDIIDTDKHYKQYEVYKNFKRNGVLLNLELSLLASIAPPLWMIYHRCWTIFGFTIVFLIMITHIILFYIWNLF